MRRNQIVCAAAVATIGVAGVVSVTVKDAPAAQPPQRSQQLQRMAQELAEGDTAPDLSYLNQRIGGDQPLAPDTFQVIGAQAQHLRQATLEDDPGDADLQWQFMGPTNIDNPHPQNSDGGGRVPDLAVDPAHAGWVYIATASGGLWKTEDGGATISNIWPITYPQAIGAVAVANDASSNACGCGTVYVGTGETNPGGGSITFYGGGVYRSTDGGATWQNIGLDQSWTIARIVVNPTNPDQVWVAVSGNLFIAGDDNSSPVQQRGVYVSNNANSTSPTWTLSLGPANQTGSALDSTTGASDLAMSQQNPDVIYAGMWDHQRLPDQENYVGPGSGVWKTTDGGAHWTDLTAPANAATDSLLPDGTTPGNGRIGIAVAPSDDQDVYVNFANDTNGVEQAFFTSTNGGTSFTVSPATADLDVSLTNGSYVYGWWFAKIFVDPSNPLHVFVTDLCLWSSTNGGASSFTSDCNVHADQHAMAWDPGNANTVYAGDDGGFYKSTQDGAVGSFVPATYQPWPQFDGLDVSEQDPDRIVGGLQDNGSQRNWNSDGSLSGQSGWNSIDGGDGQENLIDPSNQNIVYSCYQYGACQVSDDGGNTATEFDNTPLSLNQTCTTCTTTTRNEYFTPMAIDPANNSTVYYAGDEVNESNDNGNTWHLISGNLGGDDPGKNTDPLYAGHYGAATSIGISQSNDNDVWVGFDNGCLWYTTNALSGSAATTTWTEVSDNDLCGATATPPATPLTTSLPKQWVSKILIDPSNPQIVFVAFSGYHAGDNSAYVERTNDGGSTWTNLSTDLPQVTVNSLALVNGRLYAASDTGVYVSAPGADVLNGSPFDWDQVGNNLPESPDTALRYIPENGTLYVSTFGRGVWALAVAQPESGVPETAAPFLLPTVGGAVALVAVAGIRARRRRRHLG